MQYFVYILQSLRDGRFYIGQTDDLLIRFCQHQSGLSRSTKGYRPWWMPYYEIYGNRSDAIHRERELKRKKSAESIRRVISKGYSHLGLEIPSHP